MSVIQDNEKTVLFNPANKNSVESAIEEILVLQSVAMGLKDIEDGKIFSHEEVKNRRKNA